jgi:cytidylate kinase
MSIVNKHYFSVAIDGPSGAGKSSIARSAANSLGFLYVDTGAIYRTVGLAAKTRDIFSSDISAIISMLPKLSISLVYGNDGLQHMILDGKDVSSDIRNPEISMYTSSISAIPEVRAYLMETQRNLADNNNVIMDGRDIGTVVLPNAGLKIFLTASAEERAYRRFLELKQRGTECVYEDILYDIKCRDNNDITRATSPLRPAEDSVLIDTTGRSFDESLRLILDCIRDRFDL